MTIIYIYHQNDFNYYCFIVLLIGNNRSFNRLGLYELLSLITGKMEYLLLNLISLF